MKKQFLALSLALSSGIFASDEARPQMQMEDGCCQQCCCTPCCCVPKPKKCIDCECYVPAFYDLQCDWGVFVNAEYLYWYAKENRLPVGALVQRVDATSIGIGTINAAVPYKDIYMGDRWDSGFRVGIGYNSSCDGWDVHLNYTWMQNKKSESDLFSPQTATGLPEEGDFLIASPWTLPQGSGYTGFYFNSYQAKWRLRYNILDLELGKKYWLSRCFNLRPFGGIAFAWTRQNFRLNNQNQSDSGDVTLVDKESFKNKFWGGGLRFGIDPTWYFSNCFALYSEFGANLLWGKYEGKKQSFFNDDDGETTLSYTACNDFHGMQSIFDLGIGLRYEDTFCCDRYRFTLDLGWEHHLLINHVHRMQTDGIGLFNDIGLASRTFSELGELTTDLGLGGLVVRVRFDF